MATKKNIPMRDTDAAHNSQVLDDATGRSTKKIAVSGAANTAAEFLRDAFDKRNFGDALPTYKKIVYGPDPLLEDEALKKRVEDLGLEELGDAYYTAILKHGAKALNNPLMRKSLAGAIKQFGAEQVADAFRERILRIPVREVEIEAERDDELMGRPLDEAVKRYGKPGMAVKFLSDACCKVLGMRGYEVVKDTNGDPVKVGTLIMAWIPQEKADARRRHWAQKSENEIADQALAFEDGADRILRDAGGAAAAGASVLRRDETVHVNASELEDLVGQQREGGVRVERFGN